MAGVITSARTHWVLTSVRVVTATRQNTSVTSASVRHYCLFTFTVSHLTSNCLADFKFLFKPSFIKSVKWSFAVQYWPEKYGQDDHHFEFVLHMFDKTNADTHIHKRIPGIDESTHMLLSIHTCTHSVTHTYAHPLTYARAHVNKHTGTQIPARTLSRTHCKQMYLAMI